LVNIFWLAKADTSQEAPASKSGSSSHAQMPLYLISIIVGARVSFALTYMFVKLDK